MRLEDARAMLEGFQTEVAKVNRSYIACVALAAIISNDKRVSGETSHQLCQEQAELAVDYADWLLTALERGQ